MRQQVADDFAHGPGPAEGETERLSVTTVSLMRRWVW